MFKSRVRPILIPQYEHARLAGTLAFMWGNQNFARPAIDFAPFVQGVALHDWHYGIIDTLPIGEASEADWLALVRKGADAWFGDPVTDIVAKLHLRRLLSGRNLPQTNELIQQIELRIAERLAQTGWAREQFDWADKITGFCDHLAFDFCFEEPAARTLPVYAAVDSWQETRVSYEIKPGGDIRVDPWPFAAVEFSGIILGYQQAGYPEKLTPQIFPFRVANS